MKNETFGMDVPFRYSLNDAKGQNFG
jgi:hypothetical protein